MPYLIFFFEFLGGVVTLKRGRIGGLSTLPPKKAGEESERGGSVWYILSSLLRGCTNRRTAQRCERFLLLLLSSIPPFLVSSMPLSLQSRERMSQTGSSVLPPSPSVPPPPLDTLSYSFHYGHPPPLLPPRDQRIPTRQETNQMNWIISRTHSCSLLFPPEGIFLAAFTI